MAKIKKDLDIYYAVENVNTFREETGIGQIINKSNSLGWKLLSKSTAIVNTRE